MSLPLQYFFNILVFCVGLFILVPIIKGLLWLGGFYDIVREGYCHVYILFGKVVCIIDKPGIHCLLLKMGPKALIIHILGKRHKVDMRLDQQYLRSLPVNSEEGAPMGIGIWYEMYISDPVSYLFKNTDPKGSLSANVRNAAVRSLSNMPLDDMLQTRHLMSRTVRKEVSPKSNEWGYKLGSVYIRKVHFRDKGMIDQIQKKVVNRLRQVTSAIKQDGENRMNIITNSAERKAAIEFAKAMHPKIIGLALQQITEDKEITEILFEILKIENLLEGDAKITLVPKDSKLLTELLSVQG